MKVKVFQPNHNGKIEFTRTELEKLLNETYTDGFRDGEAYQREKSSWTWTSPYLYNDLGITTTASSTNMPLTINNETKPINKLTCTYDSANDKVTATLNSAIATNDASVATNATVNGAPTTTFTVSGLSGMDREAARKYVSDTVAALRRAQAAPGDVFTNLAKELNF